MLNRLTKPLSTSADDGVSSNGWDMDEQPELRLGVLFFCIFLAVSVVAARLVHVQGFLASAYEPQMQQTIERFEPIPTRDGWISTADGQVLAQDVETFNIKAHYRWIEDPPDPAWVKQQIMARLDRPSRKKPELVKAEVDKLLAERDAKWQRLAERTGLTPDAMSRHRKEVQQRVQHIVELVENKSRDRRAEAAPTPAPAGSDWWQVAWSKVATTLTTPPERSATEPIVIQEQLDYHPLAITIDRETAIDIESHAELYPALQIELSTRRTYPQGDLAPHLIGYRQPMDEAALKARQAQFPKRDPLDYQSGDRIGKTGLERNYERHLRGLRGERKLVFNRRGELIRTEVTRAPRQGKDLVLTLHVPLQQAAEQLLDSALKPGQVDEVNDEPLPTPPGGSVIAIDVRTGAILAAASAPRFDLNVFVNHDGDTYAKLLKDPRTPLFSRATEMVLPPGSVFKVLSAIAFLQSGRIDPEQKCYCQGHLFDNDDTKYRCYIYNRSHVGHFDVNLVDALAQSCNVYFFTAARRLGPAPIVDWATRFGFGEPTGVDLPNERGGNLPAVPRTRGRTAPVSGDTLGLSIGQARLTVTPMQIVRMMAAVANGGHLVTPHLVENEGLARISSSDSSEEAAEDSISAPAAKPIPGLSRSTLEWIRMGLQQVVAHPQGTGFKTVRLKEVTIAGKTGTAEAGGGKPDHAWFAGYVPAHQPRIAFVVVLENGGAGGHVAGPVTRKLVQAMLEHGLLGTPQISQRN